MPPPARWRGIGHAAECQGKGSSSVGVRWWFSLQGENGAGQQLLRGGIYDVAREGLCGCVSSGRMTLSQS